MNSPAFFFSSFLTVLGFELKASSFLGMRSTPGATPPAVLDHCYSSLCNCPVSFVQYGTRQPCRYGGLYVSTSTPPPSTLDRHTCISPEPVLGEYLEDPSLAGG
jgi:hypothetical protein